MVVRQFLTSNIEESKLLYAELTNNNK